VSGFHVWSFVFRFTHMGASTHVYAHDSNPQRGGFVSDIECDRWYRHCTDEPRHIPPIRCFSSMPVVVP
jgi:hypothetical protein